MDYRAPFIKAEKTGGTPRLPAAIWPLAFVAVLLAPIVVAGPCCGQWCLALLYSVVGSLALLAICVASLFSARLARTLPVLTQPLTRLALLVAGTTVLIAPVVMHSGLHPDDGAQGGLETSILITLLDAVYAAIKTIGLDMSLEEWIGGTRMPSDLPVWVAYFHAMLLIAYAVGSPLAAVFAAFDAVVNGVSGARIRFWSWRKSCSSTSSEIYVFHELDENGATLARDIIHTRKNGLPLIIFANVGDMEASRDDTLMEGLQDYAHGKAFLLFTSLPAEIVPTKLSKCAVDKCTIRYFVISENSITNIQTALQLWDFVFTLLWNKTWDIYGRLNGAQAGDHAQSCAQIVKAILWGAKNNEGKGKDPKSEPAIVSAAFDEVVELGTRMSIHCLYAHPDDGAILDNLANRSVDDIVSHIEETARSQELVDGIRGLAGCLRSLVEIRLLSQTQIAIYDLFERHPLYEPLDPIDLVARLEGDGEDGRGRKSMPVLSRQLLTVLILGCGTYGMEALKAAFWLGRFAGTQLKIVVVEQADVRAKMERLYVECPGLMTERVYEENLDGPRNGKWSITDRGNTATVRFCEMDVFGLGMQDLVAGRPVSAMWYTIDGGEPSIREDVVPLVSDDDHLYCVVCLNDDGTGLNAALDLQRSLTLRKLRATDVHPSSVAAREGDRVPIALRVRSEETLSSGQVGKHGLQSTLWGLGFKLRPFGSLSSIFTYELIAQDALEERALQTNAAYSKAHYEYPSYDEGRMGYYGLPEVHRLSNRASVLCIPNRLWMLGLNDEHVDVVAYQRALTLGEDSEGDEIFRKALVLPKIVDGKTVVPSGDWKLAPADDELFRRRWPLLAYVGDLEHVRWTAFYRSLGWRDIISAMDSTNADLLRLGTEGDPLVVSHFSEIERIGKAIELKGGRQHVDLKLHYYLCDSIDELGLRGVDRGDHPFAYDRIIVWLSADIMNCTVCQKPDEQSACARRCPAARRWHALAGRYSISRRTRS